MMMASNVLRVPLVEQVQQLPDDWRGLVEAFFATETGRRLSQDLEARRAAGRVIYPDRVFRALELTPLHQVRVVILGQDPYHGPRQAMGLAFSVPASTVLPPSLRNIFKELQRDLGCEAPTSGDLSAWAQQGVLLLNTSLTVEDGQAASHAALGWELLTDALIEATARAAGLKVFMLWGAHAQRKRERIEAAGLAHLVLCANHPSPLSATRPPLPFIGCGHFSAAQEFGRQQGWQIDWSAST